MFARKVDANQKAIAQALRGAGCSVEFLHMVGKGMPDLLVGRANQTHLIEVKDGAKSASRRKLTPDQKDWHAAWRGGPVHVVKDSLEALRAVGLM